MYTNQQTCCLWLLLGVSWAALRIEPGVTLPPVSWSIISLCVWLAYAVLRPERRRDKAVLWGVLASFLFVSFLAQDLTFRSWGDVYFFCGPKMQYCSCNFRWNMAGWYKAFVLWNFVLSTALGVQRLIIQLGLCGLLPGEEVVTRESFISICWRLIPYWLNNWEQQWGAECSSVMFDLPHFAVELLIILPCVQILCSRMKILAMRSVSAALPPGRDNRPEIVREECVPNVLRGCWERQPKQKHIWHRIRANKHIISFSCLLCLMAGFNALYIPLHLEDLILQHPEARVMELSSSLPPWQDMKGLIRIQEGLEQNVTSTPPLTPEGVRQEAAGLAAYYAEISNGTAGEAAELAASYAKISNNTAGEADALAAFNLNITYSTEGGKSVLQQHVERCTEAVSHLIEKVSAYRAEPRQCPDVGRLQSNMRKHNADIARMREPEHCMSVPLIDAALALMRLSTEKFFVLLSLYVTFLVFRIPPKPAAYLINLNARISSAFARLIVYSFPAVCWAYGAGFIFSTFVSVVFWGGALLQLYEFLRSHICSVSIKSLRPATAAEIERMHGDCAICWGEMAVVPVVAAGSSAGSHKQPQEAAVAAAAAADSREQLAQVNVADNNSQLAVDEAVGQQPPIMQVTPPASSDEAAHQGTAGPEAAAAGVEGAAAELVSPSDDTTYGYTLPCGHAYHHQCLNQWLQQCRSQGVTPKCPMCQAPMQLNKQWHIFGPRCLHDGQQPRDRPEAEAANNYLLQYNPRLADMLADMPNILAQENVQLLAEVQDLRIQRQQLVGELQLRQQQLQDLAGRQQQMELEGMEMEQQRRQLLQELQLLRLARDRQRQIQQLGQRSASPESIESVAGSSTAAAGSVATTGQQHAVGESPVAPGEVEPVAVAAARNGLEAPGPASATSRLIAGDTTDGMDTQRMRLLQQQLDELLREEEAGGRDARVLGRWSAPSGLGRRTAFAALGRPNRQGDAMLQQQERVTGLEVTCPASSTISADTAVASGSSRKPTTHATGSASAASGNPPNQQHQDS